MVNKEKVILMTKLASYEQGEGKKVVPIANYFRTDYISSQLLRSFLAGTFAFIVIVGVMIFYNFEFIMQDIYNTDLLAFAKKVGTIYGVCMGVYLLLSYIMAAYRYSRARSSLKGYYADLKRLNKFYE